MSDPIESAVQTADSIVQRAEEHDARAREIEQTNYYSEDHRRRLKLEVRDEFEATVGAKYRAALAGIDEAVMAATRTLRQPGDERVEAGKLAAADRVRRHLDNGGPAAAIQVLGENDDAAGLRRLRDEIPSYLAAQRLTEGERQQRTAGLLLAIDRALEPLVSGAERDAIRTRIRADDARARLQAAAGWAFSDRSPAARTTLAYSRAS